MKHTTSLIDYAVYFGSIQNFRYLLMNSVDLKPSLWLNAIHGRNAEIIHILKENDVKLHDNCAVKCLIESLKCHYNELFDYIDYTYCDEIDEEYKSDDELNYSIVKYHCFEYFMKYISKSKINDKMGKIKRKRLLFRILFYN